MILPIVAYGNSILKKVSVDIDKDYPDLEKLISDMFETMYHTEGVGLAAPQINKSIRLFVVDATPFGRDYPEAVGFRKVFINPVITEFSGDDVPFTEGCLSLPNLYEEVVRKDKIHIEYLDENFVAHEEDLSGIRSRVVQHEYDHLEGHVHVDRISQLRKIMIKGRLRDIAEGKVSVDYRMIFANQRKRR